MANNARNKAKTDASNNPFVRMTKQIANSNLANSNPEMAGMMKRSGERDEFSNAFGSKTKDTGGEKAKREGAKKVVNFPGNVKSKPDDSGDGPKVAQSKERDRAQPTANDYMTAGNYVPPGIVKPSDYNAAQKSNQPFSRFGTSDQGKPKQNTDENGQIDRSNVVRGAFGTETKIDPNDPGLKPDAASNVSREIGRRFSDPTRIINKSQNGNDEETDGEAKSLYGDNDNQETEESLDETERLLQEQEKISTLAQIAAAEEEIAREENNKRVYLDTIINGLKKEGVNMSEEDAWKLLETNFKVKFPAIMFFLCLFVEIGEVIMGIMGGILTFILPPIGFMFMIAGVFSAFAGTIGFFLWSRYYAENASDFAKKIPLARRVIMKIIFKRSWLFVFEYIPYIGAIAPVKTFLVLYYYRTQKNIANKAEKILNEAREKSGI